MDNLRYTPYNPERGPWGTLPETESTEHTPIEWHYWTPRLLFYGGFIDASDLKKDPIVTKKFRGMLLTAEALIDNAKLVKRIFLDRRPLNAEIEISVTFDGDEQGGTYVSDIHEIHHLHKYYAESFGTFLPSGLDFEKLPWERIDANSEDGVILAFLERVKHHLDTSKGDTP